MYQHTTENIQYVSIGTLQKNFIKIFSLNYANILVSDATQLVNYFAYYNQEYLRYKSVTFPETTLFIP